MKKLYFLINSLSSGGGEKILSELVNNLCEEYDITLFLLEKNDFYNVPNKVKKVYLTNFSGKESGIKKLILLPFIALKLKRYIRKYNIKLIQSHLYRANYVNVLSKLMGANHTVQIVNHGIISKYFDRGLLGKINLFLIKNLYKKANLIIWISNVMKNDANKIFKFDNPQIVIHNFFDLKKIKKFSLEKIEDFEFQKNKKYLIIVGRLEKIKRHIDAIELLTKLPESYELLILGEGEEKENLKNYVDKYNLKKRIHFLGRVKNPYKYMANSHSLISCSESESFGNVLVEGMICKIPVVSSNNEGAKEILGNNKFGLLYKIGDIEEFKDKILLLEDNKIRNHYITQGLNRSKSFDSEKIIKYYKKVLLNENSNNP